jgi:putative SOS response-associated peptidase YedK
MCGRYALYGPISRHRNTKVDDELPAWWDALVDQINERSPRYNVAPTDRMPVVGVTKEGGISIRDLRWGLVPYWAKDVKIGYKEAFLRNHVLAARALVALQLNQLPDNTIKPRSIAQLALRGIVLR